MQAITKLKLISNGLVGIKTIATRYGISKSTLYCLIRADPSFPYVNVGLKKKFMIDAEQFETWLNSRTETQKDKQFDLPTAEKLIERYRR